MLVASVDAAVDDDHAAVIDGKDDEDDDYDVTQYLN